LDAGACLSTEREISLTIHIIGYDVREDGSLGIVFIGILGIGFVSVEVVVFVVSVIPIQFLFPCCPLDELLEVFRGDKLVAPTWFAAEKPIATLHQKSG
jgi:hypothetical protein